jgi:serine/threonine protein phosphatase PrpC
MVLSLVLNILLSLYTSIVQTANIHYGIASLKGKRSYQEDRALVQTLGNGYIYAAVFDGHGGTHCSDYLYKKLGNTLNENIKKITQQDHLVPKETILQALCSSFDQANQAFFQKIKDSDYSEEAGWGTGSTAAVALIGENTLYYAHAGDSRIVYSNGIALTQDHTLKNDSEMKRILLVNKDTNLTINIKRGQRLITDPNGFNGGLAVTRSFGDFAFTNVGLIATPIVCYKTIRPKEFIIIASDGIWDVLSNVEVINFIKERLDQGIELNRIARELCIYAAHHDIKRTFNAEQKKVIRQSIELLSDTELMAPSVDPESGHDNQTVVIVACR